MPGCARVASVVSSGGPWFGWFRSCTMGAVVGLSIDPAVGLPGHDNPTMVHE